MWLFVSPLLLLVVALAIWVLSASSRETDQSNTGLESAETAGSAVTPTDPSTPLFSVSVDATPWGEVSHLVNDSGQEFTLPEPGFTPLVLQLPVGSYVATVTDPHSGDSATCQLQVTEHASQPCTIAFAPLDAIEYFKQTGWWE